MITQHQSGKKIFGRVFFSSDRVAASCWVLQYYEGGRLCSIALGIESPEAVLAAVADAADYLSCRPENIQVSERGWVATETVESDRARKPPLQRPRSLPEPKARVYYAEDDTLDPGWYLQYQKDGRLDRQALWQSNPEDVEAARTEAAWLMGCHPDEIVVGGALLEWPDDS